MELKRKCFIRFDPRDTADTADEAKGRVAQQASLTRLPRFLPPYARPLPSTLRGHVPLYKVWKDGRKHESNDRNPTDSLCDTEILPI